LLLRGSGGNINGISAVLRPVFADGSLGAAREIHAGSGWLSQDSAVQVLAGAREIKAVAVRWSNGKVTRTQVAPGITEIVIDATTFSEFPIPSR